MAETASARELEHPPEMNISDSQPHIVESYGDSWFPQSEKHASVTFGYEPIDNFCELTEGSVILIAGHTGIGIDMLVQNVVRHNIKADSRTIYFNLKESCTAIISSILTAESFAKINNSKTLTFTPKEWKRLAAAVNLFERAQLIFEPYTSSIPSISSHFLSAVMNGNADIVALDDFDGLRINDMASLNTFLYQMRNAAIQSGTIVFILFDLDESPTYMDKRPIFSDLKVNKLIKFCDIIQILYCDDNDYFSPHSETRILESVISKNYLHSQSQTFYLAQLPEYSKIVLYQQPEDKQDILKKYPGVIAGVETLADSLEKL